MTTINLDKNFNINIHDENNNIWLNVIIKKEIFSIINYFFKQIINGKI